MLGEPCVTGINLAYMGLPTCLPTKVRIRETSVSSPRQQMSVFQKISGNRLLCGIEATPRTVRPKWVEWQVLSILVFLDDFITFFSSSCDGQIFLPFPCQGSAGTGMSHFPRCHSFRESVSSCCSLLETAEPEPDLNQIRWSSFPSRRTFRE